MITAVLAAVFISIGMRGYARLQKMCFYGGMAGLLIIFGLLIFHSKTEFQAAFNHYAQHTYGSTSANAYADTIKKGPTPARATSAASPSGRPLLLIPMIAFFNLWSNWGATLYGEVRGASDFKKNIGAMAGALIVTTLLAVVFLLLIAHTMGWNFYNSANNAWWAGTDQLGGVWPYPVTLASFFVSPWLQFIVHRADVALVLRLGRHGVPDGEPRDLRDGVRPDPPGVGGPRRPQRHALLRDPDHAGAVADHLVLLRVQLTVHELDARCDARDRGDVPRLDGRGRDPAVAEAGDLQRVADREVQVRSASR